MSSNSMLYYFPSLNYWFNDYWTTYGDLNFTYLNLPEVESVSSTDSTCPICPPDIIPDKSFFKLLFNNNFTDDESTGYLYKFIEIEKNQLAKKSVRRLNISGRLTKCYIETDSTAGLDLYDLDSTENTDNKTMIDKLYDYRLGETVTLNDVDYTSLTCGLSQLVYIYLDFMINGNYTAIDTTSLISSDDSVVESLFELYVINEAHRLVKIWKEFIISDTLEIRPIRNRYLMNDSTDIFESKIISLYEPIPNDISKISLIKNGDYYDQSYYTIVDDTTSVNILLDSTGVDGLNLQSTDVLIIDYFVDAS